MKTAYHTDHIDYAQMFSSTSLDALNWNLQQVVPQGNTSSTTITPSVSPIPSSVPSPSTTVNSPAPPQDSRLHTMSSYAMSHSIPSSPAKTSMKQTYSRAPVAKPSAAEEELVRCIHRKVGGPAKLSTYDDPAKVRHVVIEALANEQLTDVDAARIRKGQLSVFERRVVRTVTNRGAAVRSRMRQRKEMAHLRHQLRMRDVRVHQLESVVRALCSAYAVPLPPSVSERAPTSDGLSQPMEKLDPMPSSAPEHMQPPSKDVPLGHVQSHHRPLTELTPNETTDMSAQQQMFGGFVDPVVSLPWS